MNSSVQDDVRVRAPGRPWIWIGIATLLGLALLDTGAWWLATAQIEARSPIFIENATRAGWQLTSGSPSRTGWPFTATVRFPAATATRPLGGTTIRWTAETIDVTLSPWHPQVLLAAAAGAQTLTVGGAAIPLQASVATLRVPLNAGPSMFEFRNVRLGLPNHDSVRLAHLTGEIETLAAGFTADGVMISPALQPPFDGPLAVSGGLHLTSGFSDAATPAASALAWQHAGGRVSIPALMVQWGPLNVSGSGEGGLDGQLQPQGQARLEVTGAEQVLDAAGRGGLLAPGPAAAIRAVLSLLSLARQGGPIPFQVTLADRTLTVAQFPLLRLPSLDWNVK